MLCFLKLGGVVFTILMMFCIGALPPGSGLANAQTVSVDAGIPPYPKGDALSGSLNSVGSDTLLNLMTFWAEAFHRIYPNVSIQIEGKGSSTAPPALIAGAAQVGPMSRRMKAEELRLFEDRFGYEPTAIGVAIDALAVYVNKDNPIVSLSLPQVDAIFSRGRRGGHPRPIDTWGEAGLSGSWSGLPIALYGRNSASGTYAYFKKAALFKGDYRDSVKEQPGSSGVVSSVAADRYGIGYSGIGYTTSEVRTVPLSKSIGTGYFAPTYRNVLAGRYPLARILYVYVNKSPAGKLDPVVDAFLRFVLAREGQAVVIKDGYLPLPARLADRERKKLR